MRILPLYLTCLTACLLCVDTAGGLSLHLLTAPVLTAFLVCWPTIFLPNRLREVVQLVIGEVFIFVCLVDAYCQEFFATPVTPLILSNTLLSNTRESLEFLSAYIGIYVFLNWRIASMLLLAIALPAVLFFLRKPLPMNRVLRNVGGVVMCLCMVYEAPAAYKYVQLYLQHGDLRNTEGMMFRHYHREVPTPLHRLAFACYAIKLSSQVLEDVKYSTFSAQADSCSHLSPHIVLVIGESYNKHHSSLYGYHLQTTPRQQKRRDKGELYVFNDVVTPWNITSNVFFDLFSLWEYGMEEAMGTKPLFTILFRRSGYAVNFFSNQYILKGFLKGEVNQAGHFFLADKEMSDSLFTFRNRTPFNYDIGLVEEVQDYKAKRNPQENTLDIIHLVGQHFEYSSRYPDSCAVYSTKTYADRSISKKAKEEVMHYDNSVCYDDKVLDSILCMYEQEEAIVLFVSDHGEEVYDDLQVSGRLFQEPTAAQVRQEFEVPMWIWCSETYRKNHPEIVERISQAVDKPFLTDALPQILLSLAGISCQWTDESRNLLSPTYQGKRRLINGNVDYDELIKCVK